MQTFNGKVGFEVDTWIRAWERQFTFPGVAAHYPANQPSLRVEAAAAYLTGGAADWWDNLDSDTKRDALTSWENFITALRKRFRPVLASELARARITALKQKGSVSAYADIFQRELAPIQAEMHPNDQIHYFRAGLKDDRIYAKIVEERPTTLLRAIDIAVAWEAQYARGRNEGRAAGYFNRALSAPQSAVSASTAAPMEISAVEEGVSVDMIAADALDEPSAGHFHAAPRAPTTDTATESRLQRMEQMMLAMLQKGTTTARSSQHSNQEKVSGLKPGEIDRLMKEGRCFRCKEKGHMKNECPKKSQLKW
jgi:hypothetical protein